MKSFWPFALLMTLSLLHLQCSEKKNKLEINFNDKNDWEFVKAIDSDEIFEMYSQIYQNSNYGDSAKLVVEQKNEQKIYDEFNLPNTIALYRQYLDRYPNGLFNNQAENNIYSLKRLGFLDITRMRLLILESYNKCDSASYKDYLADYLAKVFNPLGIEIISENDSISYSEFSCSISIRGNPIGKNYVSGQSNVDVGTHYLYYKSHVSLNLTIRRKNEIIYRNNFSGNGYRSSSEGFYEGGVEYNKLSNLNRFKLPCNAPHGIAISNILSSQLMPQLIKTFFGAKCLAFYAYTFNNTSYLYEKYLNASEIEVHDKYFKKLESKNVSKKDYNPYWEKGYPDDLLVGFNPSNEIERNFLSYKYSEYEKCNFWFLLYERKRSHIGEYVLDVDYLNKIVKINNGGGRKCLINIYNNQGENIYYKKTRSSSSQVDLSKYPKGTYIFYLNIVCKRCYSEGPYYDIITVN